MDATEWTFVDQQFCDLYAFALSIDDEREAAVQYYSCNTLGGCTKNTNEVMNEALASDALAASRGPGL